MIPGVSGVSGVSRVSGVSGVSESQTVNCTIAGKLLVDGVLKLWGAKVVNRVKQRHLLQGEESIFAVSSALSAEKATMNALLVQHEL